MDFGLTEEQTLIRDTARRFSETCSARPDRGPGIDRAVWKQLAENGFLALGLPEEHGGLGGPVEIAIVCEEFGRGPVAEPYIGTAILPGQIIASASSAAQQAALLPAIAAGGLIIAAALDDAVAPGPAGGTTARRSGTSYLLDGRKSLVLGALSADKLVVSAALDGSGQTLFLVDAHQPGLTVARVPVIDGSDCGEVWLDKVEVGADQRLGAEGGGAAHAEAGLRYAVLALAAETLGVMKQSLAIAAGHIQGRQQFGTALSSFQVLRHKVADMTIDCELAESAVFKLLASFDVPAQHDPAMSAALAKCLLGELSRRVCNQAVQLHGGMGLTEECAIGRYLRRATFNRVLFGSPDAHLDFYGDRIANRAA